MTEHLEPFSLLKNIFLFILSAFTFINAQTIPDKTVHDILKSGIKLIVDQRYDEAEKQFSELAKSKPELPLGKIYLAAVQIAKSYDYEQPFNDDLILSYLEEAKNLSEHLLDSNENDIWYNYYFALAQGYKAYYDALKEDWLSGFSTGLSSISAFEKCLELDNNFYESLIAIGSYKFWRSKKTEFINWLPFVPDEKELGIEYLKKAVKQSGYNFHLAVHSLIWIYIEQEDYTNAIKIAEEGLKSAPQSRIFKWGLARAYENVNQEKSISIYWDILNSYPKNLVSNKINEVVLKHLIAQQLAKSGRTKEALSLCNEILSIKNYSEFEKNKLEKRLVRVSDLKKELLVR